MARCHTALGVEVVAPFSAGEQVFVAQIAGFGSTRGVVVDWLASTNEKADLEDEGYYVSSINPASYAPYERELFVATLNDWGWHGDPAAVPSWYSGSGWTD